MDITLSLSWITFIGWLTLALVNAGFAQAKSRSTWGWFALSLAVGPFATLAVVAFLQEA